MSKRQASDKYKANIIWNITINKKQDDNDKEMKKKGRSKRKKYSYLCYKYNSIEVISDKSNKLTMDLS